MAKGKGEIKGWITRNGVHIPIYGTYTVREGHEPTAKGAKFKSAKVTAKTVSKALKKEYDEDSKETWYEGKINGKDVRITQETAGSNKFWNVDIGKPGDRHKLLTDNDEPMSFKSLEDAHDEIAHELNSKSGQESSGIKKDKYANRDWNKDVDDAKRYGYSEQTETGKKPVTKAEEEKQARQSFKDKKAQEQGFASAKDMESYNAETGVNKETWKTTPESYAQSKGKSIREIAQEVNNNDAARATANQLMKDGRSYDEAAALAHQQHFKAQESSTPDFSKMKYSEAGAYVAAHKKDFGLNEDDDAYVAAYEMKQGTWKGKMPGQETSSKDWREPASQTEREKANEDWYNEFRQGLTSQRENANRDYAANKRAEEREQARFEARQRANEANSLVDQGMDKDEARKAASKVDFSKMSYSEAGKHVAANKAQYGLKDSDDAYLAAYQMKKGDWKGDSTLQENRRWANDMNKKTMVDSPRSGNFNSMTVSGLKQAYANAGADEKAKIRAALQAKGYIYRGGKWTKK